MSGFREYTTGIFRPVDSSTLGAFRIAWGIVMLLEAHWLWLQTRDLHSPDFIHFHFRAFAWVEHFPELWMTQLETGILMLMGIFVSVGVFYRIASTVYFLGYTHLFLAEAAAYNNHFYLICLVSGLLIFVRADGAFSLKKEKLTTVPFWNYLILRFQVFIVYFYGGIAKLDSDWLVEKEPIRFWLVEGKHIPAFLAPVVAREWFVSLAAWGGLIIDLVCPVLLLFRKTRIPAVIVLVTFHLLNSQLFQIGLFPLIGIVLLSVFFPPRFFRRKSKPLLERNSQPKVSTPVLVFLGIFCLFQVLFPLRWHLYRPSNPSWTDVGHQFAWRMMLRERVSTLKIHFGDPRIDNWLAARPQMLPEVSPFARYRAFENPHLIQQYVEAIHERLSQYGFRDSPIYVHATSSLNGRPQYPIIDPNVDLARVSTPLFGVPEWIVPLPEDLPVDYGMRDFEKSESEAYEALEDYFEKHPGPGKQFLIAP